MSFIRTTAAARGAIAKQTVWLSALCLIALALLTGCTSAPTQPPDPAPAEKTITFWHCFVQEDRQQALDDAIARFEESHPGTRIETEAMQWPEFKKRWRAGIATGDLPDMSSACNVYEVGELLDAGLLQPVNAVVDAIGANLFSDNVLNDLSYDGSIYGVPLYSHAYVLWYRRDLLDKAQLDAPKTWDDFAEAARRTTDPMTGVNGFSLSLDPSDFVGTIALHMYMRSAGESLLNEDLTANLTSPTALEGIRYWTEIFSSCSPAEALDETTAVQAQRFYEGTTALDFNSGFNVSGMAAASPELLEQLACTALPKMEAEDADYSAVVTHIPLVLYKDARNADVCKEFMEFLFQDAGYIEFLDSAPVGMLPSVRGITSTEAYQSNPLRRQFYNEERLIENAMINGRPLGFEHGPNLHAGILASSGVIERMFRSIISGEATAEQAAASAEEELNGLFAAYDSRHGQDLPQVGSSPTTGTAADGEAANEIARDGAEAPSTGGETE